MECSVTLKEPCFLMLKPMLGLENMDKLMHARHYTHTWVYVWPFMAFPILCVQMCPLYPIVWVSMHVLCVLFVYEDLQFCSARNINT